MRLAVLGMLGLVIFGDGCGKKSASLDCDAFGAKLATCADEFWRAYAHTDYATDHGRVDGKASAAFHRGMYHPGREVLMCETFTGRRGAAAYSAAAECMSRQACDAWANCIAPAITDEP